MLNQLKILLGISADDTSKDELLQLLIATATARLTLLLGGYEPPESLEHIIVEVAIIRFNRIGSEGMTNHSVEGESSTFAEDDFSPYLNEIQAFLESQKESARGKLRFL